MGAEATDCPGARGAVGSFAGRRKKKPAAIAKITAKPPRIHHLYLSSGSGVSMGLAKPIPGRVSELDELGARGVGRSGALGRPLPPAPLIAGCRRVARHDAGAGDSEGERLRGRDIADQKGLCVYVFLQRLKKRLQVPALKVMLLGKMTTKLATAVARRGVKEKLPE